MHKILELKSELNDLNDSGGKLKQINSVLENRVNPL